MKSLVPFIWIAGLMHVVLTLLNFVLPRELRYRENLSKVAPIIRQIFVVHSVYITLILLGFAGLCFGFAGELTGGSAIGRLLSGFMAGFWLLRVAIQRFYYDAELKRQRRALDVAFTLVFAYLGVVFAIAAMGSPR
jgi:hypothetical protein